ncbi:MAG: DUF3320 domain-containing protein [Gammaproteobacteria bacterium]|nr:DUF3320 domain-containing protein [Gammaproteobacteria bacterium]
MSALIEDARKKLVDTGTRNRLVHVNRSGRGRFLNIVNERADDVFRILYAERRKMRFHAAEAPVDDEEDEGSVHFDDVDLLGFDGVDEIDESRFTDRLLDTSLGTDALQKRLLQLARDARTAEEEQGINILFLALGFLAWFEDEKSEVPREAPLILVPVDLVRNERTSTYDIRAREEDIVTNLPLQSRLRDDFGLTLPEIDDGDEWSPSAYFDAVRDALIAKPRWRLDDNGIQLGFFSFAKQLMQRDLEQSQWPEGGLAADATIRGLMQAGFEPAASPFPDGKRLDNLLPPQDIVQVIDADAPQTKVIEEVRRGRNLVVQGPPGTGKSQTITNVIAAAAHDGKTVLFMAEKMAALDVVLGRLRNCGLGDLCLELHSRHANKREVLKEIGRTLQSRQEEMPPDIDATELRIKRDELNGIADLLHTTIENRDYTPFEAMADVVGFIASDRRPPHLEREGLGELDVARRRRIERDIASLAELLAATGPRSQHPFAGCRELDLQPVALQRMGNALASAINALDDASSTSRAFARGRSHEQEPSTDEWLPRAASVADLRQSARFLDLVGQRPQRAAQLIDAVFGKESARDVAESLEIGRQWAQAKHDAEPRFRDHAWEIPAAPLQLDLERGAAPGLGSFLARLGGAYRRASKTLAELAVGALPKSGADRVELARQLADVQRRRRELADEEGFLAQHLGAAWRGERTDFEGLRDAAIWLADVEATDIAGSTSDLTRVESTFPRPAETGRAIEQTATSALERARTVVELLRLDLTDVGLGDHIDQAPLSALHDRFAAMAANRERYNEWRRIQHLVEQLTRAGLGALVAMLDDGRLAASDAVDEFAYAAAEARWELATESVPDLASLADLDRHQLVAAFDVLESEHIENVQDLIRSRHLAQLPLGAAGEMGVIRSEIARKRRHMPIRRLMDRAGVMVQRIKPVFLMSPISIAQFLPPRALRFDLLVVDEASQVRPEDALGAIARCGQIVIVGDQKQLPPTSFFDRLGADEPVDEEEDAGDGVARATEMESILTLCEARGISPRMLKWHYRSRDPSLIRVSNEEFYENQLILPPSPLELDDSYGLSFERVPGVYSTKGSGAGRPGTNRIEAEHVVQAVAVHARDWPDMSLGVVTFSKAQADMVTELLELERRQDEVLNDFLREGHAEDAFVKNIENVQGDERDVIFISVGYGPTEPGGRLANMRFGPVNAEGGERRLNVLFTRARARCRVFASFDPGDMDLNRAPGNGPRVLKRFLDFAKTGEVVEHRPTGGGADSPFEEDVANVIRSLGYLADHQVGSAGFRIDVGVRHPDAPGKYILAVECDGAAYHRALSARERDRHRQAVLEGLGWTFHRIWSTDWFHRRPQEGQRLAQALAEARAAVERTRVRGANEDGRRVEPAEPASNSQPDIDAVSLPAIAAPMVYRLANTPVDRALEPHEVPPSRLAGIVREIVVVEGPIHVDLVARRVAESFGKGRTGTRIADATRTALREAQRQGGGDLLGRRDFWLTRGQSEQIPIRDRSAAGSGADKAAMLPPMEIVAAAELIERESGRVEQTDLIREVSRLLGFRRAGTDLRRVIGDALDERR